MIDVINAISIFITALATVALAIFAFQARNSFLKQELYNFAWNFLQEYQNFREWFLQNKKLLDAELDTESTELAQICYNKFNEVYKSFLRLEIMTDEKNFKKVKEQIRKIHRVNIEYYAKEKTEEANNLRSSIAMELIQNNVSVTDLLDFIRSEIKCARQKQSKRIKNKNSKDIK